MKEIKLTQGKIAVVDDSDFDQVNQFKWYAVKDKRRWYAKRTVKEGSKNLFLHQFLFRGLKGIDHRDGNGLNNRRDNLRPATKSQNQANQPKCRKSSSRFKGVFYRRDNGKWRSILGLNGRLVHLGQFDCEEDAALAYNGAAKLFFGEFARLNAV